MPRYKLLLEYDGGPFAGFQLQEGGPPTVQAALERAVRGFCGAAITTGLGLAAADSGRARGDRAAGRGPAGAREATRTAAAAPGRGSGRAEVAAVGASGAAGFSPGGVGFGAALPRFSRKMKRLQTLRNASGVLCCPIP